MNTATNTELLHISVLYSPAPRVVHERLLRLSAGSTVAQAVDAAGSAEHALLALAGQAA